MLKLGDTIEQRVTAKVVGEYDVIVCGGGTAGCTAAIAAARNGAKVVLLEASPVLGGMLTEGNAGLTNYVYNGKDADTQTRITERLRIAPRDAQIVGGIALEYAERLIKKGAALANRTFLIAGNENYFITSPNFLKKSIRRLQSASALAKSSSALAGLVLVKLA